MKRFKSGDGEKLIRRSYDELLAAWPAAHETSFVPTRYGDTHVISAGSPAAPPLVLFHGVGDDAPAMWIYNIQELGAHFRVYALDTIGGPGKSVPNENYGRGFTQAQWMGDVWDGLKLDRASVVGVSYGGWLAVEAALALPSRVNRIAALAAGGSAGMAQMLRMMVLFLPALLSPTDANLRRLFNKLSGPATAGNELLLQHISLIFRHYTPKAMGPHRARSFSDEELLKVADRCLWLLGDRDALGDVRKAERHFGALNLNYRVIADAGHALNHDQPNAVNRLVIEFLEGRGKTG